jgi:hypothetical protein
MNKHTPGPWQWDGNVCEYDPENEAPWLVSDAYAVGGETSLSGVVLKGTINCQTEANARLIAAAPELLAALELFIADVQPWTDSERKSIARAAIAKATGEQP